MKTKIGKLVIVFSTFLVLSLASTKEVSASNTGYVKASALTVRAKASKSSKVLGYCHKGDKFTLKGSKSGFYKISYKGKTAYISKKYVTSKKVKSTSSKSSSSKGQKIVNYAKKFVGNPYRWGGTSLTRGADCSGFVKAVYKKFGYNLPHSSSSLRRVGKGISYSKKKAGDIVCYSGHVGIYAGSNKIVHAANTRKGIIVSKVSYMKVIGIRRVV